ncbi:PEPxxWA-CTERM sorting domain-containing protein [Sphingomonas sp. MMS24-J13]
MSAVPEPASWGLMIVGFGALGGAMRRRRAVVAA